MFSGGAVNLCNHMAGFDGSDNLLDFGDMGPCKVAIQLRCDLFPLHRARINTPKFASDMIAAVVQPWLSQTSLMLRGTDQCMRETSGLQTERRTTLERAVRGVSNAGVWTQESDL